MVHFLYTGTYQCLKLEGQSPQDEQIAEFAMSVRVFSMARVYRLPTLRQLNSIDRREPLAADCFGRES